MLIGLGDLFLAYTVDAVGFLVATMLLRGLPPLSPGVRAGRLRIGAAVRGVGEGFAFLRTQPVLLMTFVVDIIAMTFGWPQAVFPELSQTRFAESANSLGWLFAGASIGALRHGAVVGLGDPGRPAGRRRPRRDRRLGAGDHRVRVRARAVAGRASASRSPGPADMVSAVLRTSMLQIAAPEEMRGRMQGVFIVVVAGGPRLGDLRAGALATATSVTVAMVSGGVVIVVAMVVVALVVPSFWLFRASRSRGPAGFASPREWRGPAGRCVTNEYTTSGRLGTGRRSPEPGRQARACATTARSATSAS